MKSLVSISLLLFVFTAGCSQQSTRTVPEQQAAPVQQTEYNLLTPEEEYVIVYKGTEAPFTGVYDDFFEEGTYTCKRCGAVLYRSEDKFDANCGWPSFDDEVPGAVTRVPDPDGIRTEIICSNCGAHLGHVFTGEGFTAKDTRHCVNSVSLQFIPAAFTREQSADTAILAGGCFWGVQYYMERLDGVISTEVGYTGGTIRNPTYQDVLSHTTGHAEAVRVIFDPSRISYEDVVKYFFEIHDPTQLNRQGPDIGENYRSEIFYLNIQQMLTVQKLIGILKQNGYDVVTRVTPASTFWPAEDYHQDYYAHTGGTPYCHVYTKRF